eukprot:TRINITY_DN6770_c0_g1_i3.p1 TRINITY_DN6770_c0_g1~~TRINITY_DN6770_c0_g1_i3.p1  ORF type:complete len:387 (+),score=62.72 TRINITY_DN6770_c0_g1_i3:78-1238(+)
MAAVAENQEPAMELWTRMQTGLDALKEFAKLVSLISASWSSLQKLLNRDQRVALQVQKLREDLLVIYRDLRETHFALRQQHAWLLAGDVLCQELDAVLKAVEEACSSEPKLYRLEMALDKATFIQQRIQERLGELALIPSAPPSEGTVADTLELSFPDLTAKSFMVMQALKPNSNAPGCGRMPLQPAANAHSPEHCGRQLFPDVDGYDSAAESERDWQRTKDDDRDADYLSCDEDEFWREARCFFISGPRVTPSSSGQLLGVPLGRRCTLDTLEQAMQVLGEAPTWRQMQNGVYQHGSRRYNATIDRRPEGVYCINGPGAATIVQDLREAVDKIQNKTNKKNTHRRQAQIVYDKRGRIVKYQDDETVYFDYSGVIEDLEGETDDDL